MKRTFSQITHDECIELLSTIHNFEIRKINKWKVKDLDKDVYEGGGFEVYCNSNYFQYYFDFEIEDISIWDSKIEDFRGSQFTIMESYKLVNFLNSKGIYFKWQSAKSI